MVGTFGGALEARQISAAEGFLSGEATGEVELQGMVLVIKRIHVKLLRTEPKSRETAERVQGFFADYCPVYRSPKAAIAITTELVLD